MPKALYPKIAKPAPLLPSIQTPEEMVESFKNLIENKCLPKGIKANFSEMSKVVFKKDLFDHIKNTIPDIINCMPNDCSVRFGTFEHEGHSYLIASFPIVDVFQNPWNKQTLLLSQALSNLAGKVDYVIRKQSQASSSYSLRFKIS